MAVLPRTGCPHDCPDTCSILATVGHGRVVVCQGDPDRPFMHGFLCHKVHRDPERIFLSTSQCLPRIRCPRSD